MGPQARNLQGLLGATRPGTEGPGPANPSTRPPSQIEGSSLQSHVIQVMAVCDSSYREGIQEVHGDCPADRNTANACDASAGEGRRGRPEIHSEWPTLFPDSVKQLGMVLPACGPALGIPALGG